jgi:hypothetical protein
MPCLIYDLADPAKGRHTVDEGMNRVASPHGI